MTSCHNSTPRIHLLASLVLVASIGAIGCVEDAEDVGEAAQPAVTANNFVDLAAASAEAARGAYIAESIARGFGRTAYLRYIDVSSAASPATSPLAASVDPICNSGGTSTLIPDLANPGRYEVDFDECVVIERVTHCTVDGTMTIETGEFGGAPFVSEGVGLVVDCSLLGRFDLDGSRVECPYLNEGEGPYFNTDACSLEIASLRGDVSGLEYEVAAVEISGFGFDFDVLATIVDPDHGQFSFEAQGLDIDSCQLAVPYAGLIGGGREDDVAPVFWAIFEQSCDEFTACYFETQEDLDSLECTLTSVVKWDDIEGPITDGVIQPVSVVATSYYNAGTAPTHLIDGSGLSGIGDLETQTHTGGGNATGMWHAGPIAGVLGGPTGDPPTVATQALEFDLGMNLNLEGAYIWNMFQTGATDRGIDEFEILVSNSDTAPFVSIGTFNLAQNSDDPRQVGTIAQFRAFEALDVRRVRFEIASAHSGESTEYVGLSEVAFLAGGSPE